MKRIEATITLSSLDAFKDLALELGISEFDIVEVHRSSRAPAEGRQRLYRGREFVADVLPRLRTEFVVFDEDLHVTLDRLHRLVHPESVSVLTLDQIHWLAETQTISAPPPARPVNQAIEATMDQVISFVPETITRSLIKGVVRLRR